MAIYNVKQNPLFDANDISVAVNDTVSKMNHGDELFLEYGEYTIKNTIKISNANKLHYCKFNLLGVYTYVSDDTAILVEGEYLKFKIQKLQSDKIRSDHYKTAKAPYMQLPTGIVIGECNFSEIITDEIICFEYGLKLAPYIHDTGICYTKFIFKYISFCYIPIAFKVPDDVITWINENQFYGGRLKGHFGLKTIKGERQIDEYNNNTFYNIAFEAVETNGMDLEFSTFNTTISPRFESVMGKTIKESETCKSNKYFISVAIPFDSIDIESKYTYIQAPLHTYWEHMVNELATDKDGKKSYKFFDNKTVVVNNEDQELPMNCRNLNIIADKNSVKVKLHEISAFENNQIILSVDNTFNTITIVDHEDNVISDEVLSSGNYLIVFSDDKWQLKTFIYQNVMA